MAIYQGENSCGKLKENKYFRTLLQYYNYYTAKEPLYNSQAMSMIWLGVISTMKNHYVLYHTWIDSSLSRSLERLGAGLRRSGLWEVGLCEVGLREVGLCEVGLWGDGAWGPLRTSFFGLSIFCMFTVPDKGWNVNFCYTPLLSD